jgi:hypothetical protein
MPLPATNLAKIRTLVRQLTKSPSEQLLATQDIDDNVNTFVLYDFPEHLRLFALRKVFRFWTSPNIAVYSTVNTPNTSPLFNFQNLYITVHDPVYIAGFKALYTQSREQFYDMYPFINSLRRVATGNGVLTTFAGFIPSGGGPAFPPDVTGGVPFLQNRVLFDSIAVDNSGLSMTDFPISSTIGNLRVPNAQPTSTTVQDPNNFVNYLTGQFVVTFPLAPGANKRINSQTVPYVAQRPQAMLFYNEEFVLRPVPDQPYEINMEVYVRPAALLDAGSSPQLEQWWQYIAYGAAKKVLEARLDIDTVALIMPEYKKQEALVLRSTIVQNTNERTATIYTEQSSAFGGPWGWNQNN